MLMKNFFLCVFLWCFVSADFSEEVFPHLDVCRVSLLYEFSYVQQGWISEDRSPAFITFIGFLFCVDPLILSKIWFHIEGFPIFITFLWLFSRVSSVMHHEDWLLAEGFLTFVIFIRFFSCLSSLMFSEVGLHKEGLSTVFTFICFFFFFPYVYSDVEWGLVYLFIFKWKLSPHLLQV